MKSVFLGFGGGGRGLFVIFPQCRLSSASRLSMFLASTTVRVTSVGLPLPVSSLQSFLGPGQRQVLNATMCQTRNGYW